MPLINNKIKLELKWVMSCVVFVFGNKNNDNSNSNYIIFTIKETDLYVPVVTFSIKDNKKLPKFISQRFDRQVY